MGQTNPLCYRGYVYDHETGLYYNQTRYYNPVIGRFINSDVYAGSRQGLQGYNIFIYCLNNPVKYADYNGLDAIVLFDKDALGHIGIMAQDENGVWYHFYWGASSEGSSSAGSSNSSGMSGNIWDGNVNTSCVPYDGEITLKAINQSGVYSASYDDMEYFTGDFSTAVELMSNARQTYKSYNLITNNCSLVSSDILAKSNAYYSELFNKYGKKMLPLDSFFSIRMFRADYEIANSNSLNIVSDALKGILKWLFY